MESTVLLDSLCEEAGLFSRGRSAETMLLNRLDFVIAIFRSLSDRFFQRASYPHLFGCAWRLLVLSLEEQDWATLGRINDVLKIMLPEEEDATALERSDACAAVSLWHLKSIVYCWAYLQEDSLQRRSHKEATALLQQLRTMQCFLNLTPKEARRRLSNEPMSRETRPYLLRLSTTKPGIVTLTFQTPVQSVFNDWRISLDVAQRIVQCDQLYNVLAQIALRQMSIFLEQRDGLEQTDFEEAHLLTVLSAMEPSSFDCSHCKDASRPGIVLTYDEVVPELERIFWSNIPTYRVKASSMEERIGQTESYAESYSC